MELREVAMSNKKYHLQFKIRSFWQAGSGRGGGALIDAIVHKDANGLPFLPGRTIKGLLRDAVYRVEQWKHVPENTSHCFFGSALLEEGITRLETEPGALAISDATLPAEIRKWLSHPKTEPQLRQALFKQLSVTAIDPATGSAIDRSLRSIEVTIPLTLTAQITVLNEERLKAIDWGKGQNWINRLEPCLKLILAVGASRSRGLGRVTVTLINYTPR
jgi:CRISPR/Cas system CSM-associated protein Csm3 (group 7 of RAMP superfamily)